MTDSTPTSIGVVMDPISAITFKKDSTLAMLWAAGERNWQIYYLEQRDMYLTGGEPRASMRKLQVFRDPARFYTLGDVEDHELESLDVILMRKDPPFDQEYIYSTYILEAAAERGTLVVNPPQALRDCNEKVVATRFPQCCPPVLVSGDERRLRAFHQQYQDIILKPLDGMGGQSVFRVKPDDPNLSVIVETLTDNGKNTVMAQRFIPEISQGDKRILIIDGEPVPFALARIPAHGETRGNLAAGGKGVAQELTDRDRWICEEIRPFLKSKQLCFVGIDVIGDYLTEINVTSPTGIRELNDQQGLDIGAELMTAIDKKLQR